MSIGHMTDISHAMFGISGVFAAVGAVMFFVLDIAKIWRVGAGDHLVGRGKKRGVGRKTPAGGKKA